MGNQKIQSFHGKSKNVNFPGEIKKMIIFHGESKNESYESEEIHGKSKIRKSKFQQWPISEPLKSKVTRFGIERISRHRNR